MKVFQARLRLPERQIFRWVGAGQEGQHFDKTSKITWHSKNRWHLYQNNCMYRCFVYWHLIFLIEVTVWPQRSHTSSLAPPIMTANMYRVYQALLLQRFEHPLKVTPCVLITQPHQTSCSGWFCSIHTSVFPRQHIDYWSFTYEPGIIIQVITYVSSFHPYHAPLREAPLLSSLFHR